MFYILSISLKKFYVKLRFFIYNFCVACWGAPDDAATIIFNEQPNYCLGTHNFDQKTLCTKKHCEVCRVDHIVKYIDAAKYSLDIAQLMFSSRTLLEAVLRAYRRGVCIRLATDREMRFVRGNHIYNIINRGIEVRVSREDMIMHHKFCIIDGDDRLMELILNERADISLWQRRSMLMTGSLNWTKQGLLGNFENVVFTTNAKMISAYQPIFDFMWERFDILKAEQN